MILADMIAKDENALMCDLAETYHIYDYKSLPLSRVAIFAVGLRDDSRIKMKISGMKYPTETLLLASAVDRLSLLAWMNSKDGANGINRPKSVLNELIGQEVERDIEAFNSPEEFEKRRNEILAKGVT
jgi:hypothetical protein